MPAMELKSEYAFTLYVKLAEPVDFGNTFNGDRRLIPITGGRFEGPKIKGEIMPGGTDPSLTCLIVCPVPYSKYFVFKQQMSSANPGEQEETGMPFEPTAWSTCMPNTL